MYESGAILPCYNGMFCVKKRTNKQTNKKLKKNEEIALVQMNPSLKVIIKIIGLYSKFTIKPYLFSYQQHLETNFLAIIFKLLEYL